ncbi:hypothetical protein DFH08DRAFT_988980 [Mycena albidolilacea]|uniref:Uncharacterized protein n=1 Tax=Mycena albidolilacea TaxID=1033008 RepID=A0AAD6Z0E8_9AGAR|nr:hypothetical protein DFH08DRAFT_988980 [Mycena albidolilacea]
MRKQGILRRNGQRARRRGEGVAMWSQTACGGRRLRSDSGGAAMGGNSKTGNSKTAATALSSEAERNGHGRGPGAEGAGVGQRGRGSAARSGVETGRSTAALVGVHRKQEVMPGHSHLIRAFYSRSVAGTNFPVRLRENGRLFAEWKMFGMSVKGIYQTGECWRRRVDYWVLGNTIARKRRYEAEKKCNAQQLWEHAVWPASTCSAAT